MSGYLVTACIASSAVILPPRSLSHRSKAASIESRHAGVPLSKMWLLPLSTSFELNANGWVDDADDLPLTYAFFYLDAATTASNWADDELPTSALPLAPASYQTVLTTTVLVLVVGFYFLIAVPRDYKLTSALFGDRVALGDRLAYANSEAALNPAASPPAWHPLARLR